MQSLQALYQEFDIADTATRSSFTSIPPVMRAPENLPGGEFLIEALSRGGELFDRGEVRCGRVNEWLDKVQ